MSLDVNKLEKVRELAGGGRQARCPACAEGGQDRRGEHLRIYPDGRFGCCVNPKDGEHRKRIFALAGCQGSGPVAGKFTVRIKTHSAAAVPMATSVKAVLTTFDGGMLGIAKAGSENGLPVVPSSPVSDFGTLGTVKVKSRACAREELPLVVKEMPERLEDLGRAVPSVPASCRTNNNGEPSLTADGDLSIPFDSAEHFHWWRGGQSIAQTLNEVRADADASRVRLPIIAPPTVLVAAIGVALLVA